VLAIDASGDHARARELADAFLAAHPGSTLDKKVRALLAP
jgi:hypothetical protein